MAGGLEKMEWFVAVTIVIVGLILGYVLRDQYAKKRISFVALGFVIIVSIVFEMIMMPLLIAFLGAVIFYVLSYITDSDHPEIWTIAVFFGTAVALIFWYPTVAIPATVESVETGNISLVALHDKFAPSGSSFILGTGTTEEVFYYTYYYRKGDEVVPGSIQWNKNVHLYANRTDGKGSINFLKNVETRKPSHPFESFILRGAPQVFDGDRWIEIRIPPDSIAQGVTLDGN